MHKTSNLVRGALAAALVLSAGGAMAEGTWTPEIGIGAATGKHVYKSDGHGNGQDPAFMAAFGYETDAGLGARVLWIGDFDIASRFLPNQSSFASFLGVQVTDRFKLADQLALRGGLGVGRSRLEADNLGPRSKFDGALSLGLQWQPATHYAMEVRVDHLTTTGTTVFGLQFQVPF